MTNIKPMNGIAAVLHLPFIQKWTEIEKSQPELRSRHHPRPGAKVGEAFALPKMACAYLIIKGEITEKLHLDGIVSYEHPVRILQAGAVFLLQAIDPILQNEKLMCSYTAGNSCELQTLTEVSASALGLTSEIRSYIIREEQRLLESFLSLHERQNEDFEFTNATRRDAEIRLEEVRAELVSKNEEIIHLRKDNARLTVSFADLEQEFERSVTPSICPGMTFSEEELEDSIPEGVIPERSIPIEDAPQELLEEIEKLQSAVAEEGNTQESTKNGVAPPSVVPLSYDSEATTLAPPPKLNASDESTEGVQRPTLDYLQIAPFVGHASEEPPPSSSEYCDSKAPTQTNIQPPQIPQQTGVANFQAVVDADQEPADLSEPEEQRRMTLIHAAVRPANAPEEHAPPSSISGPLGRGAPLVVPSIRNPFDPNKP